jgi:uncharacterized protein YndB with AHSA1/START domain
MFTVNAGGVLSARRSAMPGAVRFHRVLTAPPARVFKAFTGGDALAKWPPRNGFTGKVRSIHAQVEGEYRMSFTNLSSGKSHGFGGEYLEFLPGEKLRYADRFDDPNLTGSMEVSISFRKVSVGAKNPCH